MFPTWSRRWRERQLAGDARAGVWSRNEARRLHWAFVRRRRWLLLRMAGAAAAVIAVTAVFLPAGFLRGAFVGGCSVAACSAMAVLVMQSTGTAYRSMGATAEQWTASELRPLRKVGWHVINHMSLRPWDIDHVMVGRGRLLAVETKWSSHGWSMDAPDGRLVKALEQVRRNSNDLRRWQPVRESGIESVEPILFLWGFDPTSTSPRPAVPIRRDGVVIVHGPVAAKAWRTMMLQQDANTTHDPDAMRKLWEALDERVRKRDEWELASAPPPPTLTRLYWTGFGCLLCSLLAFYLSIETFQLSGSSLVWVIGVLASLTGGIAARRAPALRTFGTAWLTGVGLNVVGIAIGFVTALTSG